MIRLENISARLGRFELCDVSFEVPDGGYGLLIGPTGSGKTSLLEIIAGHTAPRAGRVWLRGSEVTHEAPENRAVGMVYQHGNLFPHLSVAENIRYGLAHGTMSRADQTARVRELAEPLGLSRLLDRGTRNLSGGEAQRVGIARALAPRPSILLLDEPFAALDPATRFTLRDQLLDLHHRERVTTLQVTHEFQEALQLGDLVAVMADGAIAQKGRPEEVFRYPNSAFVARFIGAANVMAGDVRRTGSGGQTDDARFVARFIRGALDLEVIAAREGRLNAVIHPEDITLSLTPPGGSARNVVRAIVTRLEFEGPVTYVYLDAGHSLRAAITTESAGRMKLSEGMAIIATIKATAIRLV